MKELSKIIYEALSSAKLPGVLKKVFPVIANAGTDFPFVIYKVKLQNNETKDKARNYSLVINVYHSEYFKTLDLLDLIETKLVEVSYDNKKYSFRMQSQDVNFNKNDEIFVGEMILNIKK